MPCDENCLYKIKLGSKRVFEGHITQKGKDELGHYIVFQMWSSQSDLDLKIIDSTRINKGKAELSCILNPSEVEGAKGVLQEFENKWPVFFAAQLKFIEEGTDINLVFQAGALGDKRITIKLETVIDEKYIGCEGEGIDYFFQGNINNVYIRKNEDNKYMVTIDDTNCFNKNGEMVIYENKAVFTANSLKFECDNAFLKELEELEITYEKVDADQIKNEWFKRNSKGIDLSDIYIEEYYWHMFSYKRRECLDGEMAVNAFNSEDLETVYIFFQQNNICYKLENAKALTDYDIRFFKDVYVTSEDFSKTFVITHESGMCGPYYCEI